MLLVPAAAPQGMLEAAAAAVPRQHRLRAPGGGEGGAC
jgi:hypothetical protein